MIYDLTIPMNADLAVWPGDTAFHFGLSWKMAEGASVNVGAVTMSVHTGTHADAPFHFDGGGEAIDALDLAVFVGPAIVVDVMGKTVIEWDDLASVDFAATPRVLLKTLAWTDHTRFPDTIPTLALDVPGFLAERGALLLGVDLPSVDAISSMDLPIHHALAAGHVAILESLDLRNVPAGRYELIALPLRLAGADGAPVRAVLRGLF